MADRKLADIAFAVSGDKGENANIGVIAYREEDYSALLEALTEERVSAYFEALKPVRVRRYELPNLWALNFVLEGVLAGGLRGLETDAQGKTLGVQILEMPL